MSGLHMPTKGKAVFAIVNLNIPPVLSYRAET